MPGLAPRTSWIVSFVAPPLPNLTTPHQSDRVVQLVDTEPAVGRRYCSGLLIGFSINGLARLSKLPLELAYGIDGDLPQEKIARRCVGVQPLQKLTALSGDGDERAN